MSLLWCSMNGNPGKSLSIEKAAKLACLKTQLKVQTLCTPSYFPELSSGPDWSLSLCGKFAIHLVGRALV